jgi:hypoxanthine phosphoribosyltransferase
MFAGVAGSVVYAFFLNYRTIVDLLNENKQNKHNLIYRPAVDLELSEKSTIENSLFNPKAPSVLLEINDLNEEKTIYRDSLDTSSKEIIRKDSLKLIHSVNNESMLRIIDGLVGYSKRIKPQWIVGVHTGGRILSAHVANILNFPENKCIFAHTISDRSSFIEFNTKYNMIDGNILVIDDVRRSGRTLEIIRGELYKRAYEEKLNIELHFAVLFDIKSMSKSYQFAPDWIGKIITDNDVLLPWSELSSRTRLAYYNRSLGSSYDREIIEQHERFADDMSIAKSVASDYMARLRK